MQKSLQKMRSQIDEIDKELIKVLSKRFAVSREIGKYKKKEQLPSQDKTRESQMFLQRKSQARKHGLPEILIEKIFCLIIKQVIKGHAKTK